MAPSQADVDRYRSALGDVNALTQQALLQVWGSLDLSDIGGTAAVLSEALPDLADQMSGLAATVAADHYEVWREEAAVSSTFRPVLAAPPAPGRLAALARWATGPLYPVKRDNVPLQVRRDTALTRVSGGLQRAVADRARSTIVISTRRDPARVRWARITSPKACDFCQALAARGPVYSQDTSRFASHDHCRCSAVPDFGGPGDAVEVLDYQPSERLRSQAQRDANNARIRQWMQANRDA